MNAVYQPNRSPLIDWMNHDDSANYLAVSAISDREAAQMRVAAMSQVSSEQVFPPPKSARLIRMAPDGFVAGTAGKGSQASARWFGRALGEGFQPRTNMLGVRIGQVKRNAGDRSVRIFVRATSPRPGPSSYAHQFPPLHFHFAESHRNQT
jgi:hypothetical protein